MRTSPLRTSRAEQSNRVRVTGEARRDTIARSAGSWTRSLGWVRTCHPWALCAHTQSLGANETQCPCNTSAWPGERPVGSYICLPRSHEEGVRRAEYSTSTFRQASEYLSDARSHHSPSVGPTHCDAIDLNWQTLSAMLMMWGVGDSGTSSAAPDRTLDRPSPFSLRAAIPDGQLG